MANLNYFGIENFRSFNTLTQFELKPITIITGTNSSGKSSLIKAMLLFKNSFKNYRYFDVQRRDKDFFDVIDFCMEQLEFVQSLQIGNFETCMHNSNKSEKMTFQLPFRLPFTIRELVMSLTYKQQDNAMKNGELQHLVIMEKKSKTELINYSVIDEKGQLKINFLELWKLVEELKQYTDEIANAHDEITREINTLLGAEKSDHIIQPLLGYNENDANAAMETVRKKIPRELLKRISFLRNERINLSRMLHNEFHLSYEFDDNSRVQDFESSIVLHVAKSFPLLVYIFVFRDETIIENLKSWLPGKTEEERLDVFNECIKIKKYIKNKIGSDDIVQLRKYIQHLELAALNNYTIDKQPAEFGTEGIAHFFNELVQKNYWRYGSDENVLASEIFNFLKSSSPEFKEIMQNKNLLINDNKILKNIENTFGVKLNIQELITDVIYNGIGRKMNHLAEIFASISFIPSVRGKAQRIYTVGSHDSYLNELILEYNTVKFHKESIAFLNRFLREFDIADRVTLDISNDSTTSRVIFYKNDKPHNIADLGYGISQVLPILLKIALNVNKIYTSKENPANFTDTSSIIIIEEPETNLHPALQSKLADLFVECYKRYRIQIIAETHSEYLIRKLQVLTAQKEFNNKDIQIYYFYPSDKVPEGEKQVYAINIQDDGALSKNFGIGFFDEASNLSVALHNYTRQQNN